METKLDKLSSRTQSKGLKPLMEKMGSFEVSILDMGTIRSKTRLEANLYIIFICICACEVHCVSCALIHSNNYEFVPGGKDNIFDFGGMFVYHISYAWGWVLSLVLSLMFLYLAHILPYTSSPSPKCLDWVSSAAAKLELWPLHSRVLTQRLINLPSTK